jgi:hypothetical protein
MKRKIAKCLGLVLAILVIGAAAYGLAAAVSGITHGHGSGGNGSGTAPGLTNITGHKKGHRK